MTFPAANAIYRRETYDNYPAARAILQVVYEGLQLPFDTALRVESRWFAKILRSPEAAAMIRSLFVSMQDLNKGARRPPNEPPTSLKKIGVVGAGFMGAGIAQVSAAAGLQVVLVDRDQETADKGKAGLHKALSDRVMKGRMKGAERDELLGRITPTPDYAALKDCDLIIEAVYEDRKIKSDVIAKIQAVIGDKRDFCLEHVDFADQLARLRIQGSGALHRHSFFLAGRPDDAGRDHPRQADRQQGARGIARLCARHPQDAHCRERLARLLHLARGRHLYPRRPSDADGRRSGSDDRECRPHGGHAGRPACRSTTKWRSISPGKSSRPPKPISAPRRSIRGKRNCCRKWSRSAAASDARTARDSTTIRRAARRNCGLASPICSRRSCSFRKRSTSRNSSCACSASRRSKRRAASRKKCSPTCARPMSARSSASALRRSPAARCRGST